MLAKVNFCYQCGRPVGSQAVKCIYCSAPTRRIIRPERRCPYCDEPIRHKAVKCVHCGEFLDGRPKEEKAIHAKSAQPTFIIEQAIITPQGLAAPPPPTGLLGSGGGPRALIGPGSQGGMRGLPAPLRPEDEDDPIPYIGEQIPKMKTETLRAPSAGSDSVLEVEGAPSSDHSQAAASRELAVRTSNAPVAARSSAALPATVTPAVAPLPPVLLSIIEFIKGLFVRKPIVADDTLNISSRSEEDNYRTCMMCQTEILSVDNFCYHCGQQFSLRPSGRSQRAIRPGEDKSNAFLYVLVVISIIGYGFCEELIAKYNPEAVKPALLGCAAVAPLLSIFAFLRKPGFVSRLLSVLFLAVSLLAIIWFLPDAFRSQK